VTNDRSLPHTTNRCLINLKSKWLDAAWVRAAVAEAAAAAAAGGPLAAFTNAGLARVRCCWHQTGAATGRLSCSAPNLQAVTKYTVEAEVEGAGGADGVGGGGTGGGGPLNQSGGGGGGGGGYNRGSAAAAGGVRAAAAAAAAARQRPAGALSTTAAAGADDDDVDEEEDERAVAQIINVRSAFVAPRGKLLLSADFSQIELRFLAHFSREWRGGAAVAVLALAVGCGGAGWALLRGF